eukprot:3781948-Amphidinium_carterae.1
MATGRLPGAIMRPRTAGPGWESFFAPSQHPDNSMSEITDTECAILASGEFFLLTEGGTMCLRFREVGKL